MKKADKLWKEIIRDLFYDFVEYFMPEFHNAIDHSKGYEFLDKELAKLFSKSEKKDRIADTLVKVFLKNGEEIWALIHIEVQGYQDDEFAKRMYITFYRLSERYNKNIVAIAIFSDSDAEYKPDKYEYDFFGTKLSYLFNTYKILGQNEDALKKSTNPFATVILAGLYSILSKRKKNEVKYRFKCDLIKLLKEKNYSKDKIRKIFLFIEGLIILPDKLQLQIEEETEILEKEDYMPLTIKDTNFFRVHVRKARKEGREEERKKYEEELRQHEEDRRQHEEDRRKEKIETVKKLFRLEILTNEQIADISGMSLDEILELRKFND
ncbi:MAG: hypothetical protein HQK76_02845 [Desulfobacterales bacterium]|nr:hypothetical protein [Desulfobacterales bacterium]